MAADGSSTPSSVAGSTKQTILDVAVRLVEERGVDGFTVDDVLVEADASASSLYHHFRNREGLVRAVEEERYRRGWSGQRANLQGGISARTSDEFLAYIAREIRRTATDPVTIGLRRSRLQVAARALDSRELADARAQMQEQVIAAIAEMFADAQARGLIDADLDTRAFAGWYMGMLMGRAFTEDGTLDVEDWLKIAVPAVLDQLRPRPS